MIGEKAAGMILAAVTQNTAAPNFGRRKQMAPSPQQSTGTNTYVEVVPLTLHMGAEIRGVDLSKPLSPEQLKEVRDAFLRWKVVFFRGHNLDHAQHVAMARQFGTRRSATRCSAISRAIPRSIRSPKTAPPMKIANR
jgi:hypothetical protein